MLSETNLKQIRWANQFVPATQCPLPMEVEGFDSLAELALDLRWPWNQAADHVWRQLDPALWGLTLNPFERVAIMHSFWRL